MIKKRFLGLAVFLCLLLAGSVQAAGPQGSTQSDAYPECRLEITYKKIHSEKLFKHRKRTLKITGDEYFDAHGQADLGPLTLLKQSINTKKNRLKVKVRVPAELEPGMISIKVGDCYGEIEILGPECEPAIDFVTGVLTLTSDEVEREYYLKLPSPYDPKISYPLIFGFHGFTGDYTNFTEGYYDLQEAVGDEAILVYPNALEINGKTQWDLEADLGFFNDLYAELEANLCFDKRKVFAVGHSNGAVFTNMLGCRRGDVLRAIGPVSGIFSEDYEEKACIGQVASITMHGDNDTTIPQELALPGRDYWVAINSCSSEASESTQGANPSCVAYTDCDPEYPVQYCEYSGKHNWPDFGGAAIWTFFKSLVPVIPSSTPGIGEPPPLPKGSASIKIKFPLDFVGTPDLIALSLYASGTTLPPVSAPKHILADGFPAGEYTLGHVKEYNAVKIFLRDIEFGDYAFIVAVYVEGGVYPVPTPGKDYMGLQEITIDSSTINIETPFDLELLVYE